MATLARTMKSDRMAPTTRGMVPALRDGERLDRKEFHRRYLAMPEVKRAELIQGVVFMPSPVNHKYHGKPHIRLGMWLEMYSVGTPGTDAGDNSSLFLSLIDEPQPDLFLRLDHPEGVSRLDRKGYVNGCPELVVEISASSVARDRGPKRSMYESCGVKEYVVWCPPEQALEWHSYETGSAARMMAADRGIIKSKVFPGLWLSVPAILGNDGNTLIEVLREGLASSEHAAFVKRLAKRK